MRINKLINSMHRRFRAVAFMQEHSRNWPARHFHFAILGVSVKCASISYEL